VLVRLYRSRGAVYPIRVGWRWSSGQPVCDGTGSSPGGLRFPINFCGLRVAGRVSEGVSVFGWGVREAESVRRGRERSAGRGLRKRTPEPGEPGGRGWSTCGRLTPIGWEGRAGILEGQR
jgi:hypothetical protein